MELGIKTDTSKRDHRQERGEIRKLRDLGRKTPRQFR